jgi:hypothetical protein
MPRNKTVKKVPNPKGTPKGPGRTALIDKPRNPGQPLADPIKERFAQQLAAGLSATAAFHVVKPAARDWKAESVRVAACRMANEPTVQTRRDEILADMIPSTVMKKADLMVLLSDEIHDAAKEPGNLAASAGLVDKFIKLMDWYPHPEVTVKNGGVSADYTPPPAIAQLDPETLKKLAAGSL